MGSSHDHRPRAARLPDWTVTRRARRIQRARPPSHAARRVARLGIPLGIFFAVLTVLGAASLAVNLVQGNGVYNIVMAALEVVIFGGFAYGVGIELPRNIAAWDSALAERRQLTHTNTRHE